MVSKTFFVISDIHSYYDAMRAALDEAGYDQDRPDHFLILCGDAFDRGDDTLKVLSFLESLPKDRRVLIRGNHELLLKLCYESGVFYDTDEHNGTNRTMCHLSGIDPDFRIKWYRKMIDMSPEDWSKGYQLAWDEYLSKPFDCPETKRVIDWIFSDAWVNYYEFDKYVFVHSWVPTKTRIDENFHEHETVARDWRNASNSDWNKAMWGCPWKHYLAGSLPKDKTIVCGHWHVQDFHTHLGHDVDGYKNRSIYFSDRLIALDACTALEPHLCNVLVIKDGVCYDQHGNVLKGREEEK